MVTAILLLVVLTAGVCLYKILRSTMTRFDNLDMPHEKPVGILGNMAPLFFRRMSLVEAVDRIYKLFPNAKYFGLHNFTRPAFVIRDPDLINTIAIKQFDHFCDHRNFANGDIDRLVSKNLFSLKGDHWREMRKLLSPTFTSSKMKMMFELMCQCADNFTTCMADTSKFGKTINVKEEMCRYSNDVVASCAFGISLDSFKYPNNEFYVLGRKAMNFEGILSIKFFMNMNFPKVARFLKLRLFNDNVENFFKNLVRDTVKIRDEKGITRPDMIQLMMENRDNAAGPVLDIEEMTAQAFIFFIGGFDSVSTMMCFLLHELAANPNVQDKLRAEVERVLKKNDGKPTYEAINSMKYLDAVVTETMRLYPLGAFIDRLCVKDFELPPAIPGGQPIMLKAGDSVWFPGYSIHRDPNYYPEPNKFDPDRFLDGHSDSPTYLPFGLGPRICIGNRFALMEMKIMLFYMLWRCDLEPDVKTKIPMVLNKKTFVMMAEGGFWLKLRTRKAAGSLSQ